MEAIVPSITSGRDFSEASTVRFVLTDLETQGLDYLPDKDLADWAVELDLMPAEEIDRHGLLEELVPRLMDVARREGLPFSKYDALDLDELPDAHRRALARAMGWKEDTRAMVRAGEKIWKVYRKNRPGSAIPLMLPLLLKPLARFAYEMRPA
jgi:hypothetical protein